MKVSVDELWIAWTLRKDFESFDVFDVVDQPNANLRRERSRLSLSQERGGHPDRERISASRVRGSRIAVGRESGTRNPEPVLWLLARCRIHLVPMMRGLVSLLKETHSKHLQAAMLSHGPNIPNR